MKEAVVSGLKRYIFNLSMMNKVNFSFVKTTREFLLSIQRNMFSMLYLSHSFSFLAEKTCKAGDVIKTR